MERKSAVEGRKSVVATVKDSKVYAFKDSVSACFINPALRPPRWT